VQLHVAVTDSDEFSALENSRGYVHTQKRAFMFTAIYTRVSTDKQTTDSQSEELRAYCHRRGWSEVREFTDVISGAKFTRRGLDELISQVRKGKVET
jgi:predicted site-specific integrase-resolvase